VIFFATLFAGGGGGGAEKPVPEFEAGQGWVPVNGGGAGMLKPAPALLPCLKQKTLRRSEYHAKPKVEHTHNKGGEYTLLIKMVMQG